MRYILFGLLFGGALTFAAAEVVAACITGARCCFPDSFCGEVPCGPSTGEHCQCCWITSRYVCCQSACSECSLPCDPGQLEPCE